MNIAIEFLQLIKLIRFVTYFQKVKPYIPSFLSRGKEELRIAYQAGKLDLPRQRVTVYRGADQTPYKCY